MQIRTLAHILAVAAPLIIGACGDDPSALLRDDIEPQQLEAAGPVAAEAVAAAAFHTCAVKSDGNLSCWGSDSYGQASVPAGLGRVQQVAAGREHTCVIKSDGRVACWGSSSHGQRIVPATLGTVVDLSAGALNTCTITTSNELICWGYNTNGISNAPYGLGPVRDVTAGAHHTCVIKMDDSLACWGLNTFSQSTVPPGTGAVDQVAAGEEHTCAIKSNNTLTCWGKNYDGQILVPAALGDVKRVAARGATTCVVKADDTVQCWGSNEYNQTTLPSDLGAVREIAMSELHVCAIKTDETLRCWGTDTEGQASVPQLNRYAPQATFTAPATVPYGGKFIIGLTDGHVQIGATRYNAPGSGIRYRYDCGSGSFTYPTTNESRQCNAGAVGPQIVRGRVQDGDGDFTEFVDTVIVAETPPLAPTGLTASITGLEITLTWNDAASNEDTYVIQRATFANGAWTAYRNAREIAANSESFTAIGLMPATSYRFKVSACNEVKCRAATTGDLTTESVPAAPDTVLVSVNSGSSIKIDWVDLSGNETSFLVERSEYAGSWGPYQTVVSTASNIESHVDNGRAMGTRYMYRVSACNAVACSVPVRSIMVVIPKRIPASPENVVATGSYEIAQLQWSDVSVSETYFKIMRRQGNGAGGWSPYAEVPQAPANATSAYIAASPGWHQFKIFACNSLGCSAGVESAAVEVVDDPISGD